MTASGEVPAAPVPAGTSIGLSPRVGATLAYLGWWLTGGIFWFLERRDRFVRFHAAQALVVFGLVALLIAGFCVLAAAALSFWPKGFVPLLWAALGTWLVGVLLWVIGMWKAANGTMWRVPFAASLADRLV